MLEKCEQATQGYTSSSSSSRSSPNGSSNGATEPDSFSRDVHAFVQMLEKEKKPLLTNNPELDGLMIKALQVLRIHLLELEKVQELCRDFCTRYIACLRGKMQSENLLRSDYSMEHNNNLSNSNSPINSPDQVSWHSHFITSTTPFDIFPSQEIVTPQQNYYHNTDYMPNTDVTAPTDFSSLGATTATYVPQNGTVPHLPPLSHSTPLENGGGGGGGDLPPHHMQLMNTSAPSILGSTPLSQIGCPPLVDQYAGQLSPCGSSDEMDSNDDDLGSNFSSNSSSKRQKRGILPKHATSVMRAWLFQHLVHPYPTEDEKRAIAAQTNLTLLQVSLV